MPEEPNERFGRDESVKQCIEILTDVMEEQRARSRHLDTKCGALAGFCVTALTLNVVLGRPVLAEDLGSVGDVIVEVSFVVASAALAGAAIIAVWAGRPMGFDDLTEQQIDAYSDRPKVITDPEDLRMTWLRTLSVMTESSRSLGDKKAKHSIRSVRLLLVGVVAIATLAVTLVFAMSDDDKTPKRPDSDAVSPHLKAITFDDKPKPPPRPNPDSTRKIQEGKTADDES